MASLLIAWLSLLSLAPGLVGQRQLPAAVLTPPDHEALGGKLREWFDAHISLVGLKNDPMKGNNARAKDNLRREAERAKRVFEDELDKVAKPNKLASGVLRNMVDVKAIFSHAFRYHPAYRLGQFAHHYEDGPVGLWVPKGYVLETAWPLVLSLPPRASDGRWVESRQHLEDLWGEAPLLERAVLVAPAPPPDMGLDQPLVNRLEADQVEARHNRDVMETLRDVFPTHHIDTNRIVLECSRTNCVSALRMASCFPHMFAGIVVRDPADLASVRPDNFRHLPILFVVSSDSEPHADAFRARLAAEGIQHGRKHRSRDAFPFRADNAEIGQWIRDRVRDPFPEEVTLAPTSDRYKKAYWVGIDKCGPVATARPEERPRLEARIDRAQNQFWITTRGVGQFSLLVNDALVDLDRPIEVFVNGQIIWRGKKARNLDDLANGVLRTQDANWLFVREITSLVVPPVSPAPAASTPSAQPAQEPPARAPATPGPGAVLAVLTIVFSAALLVACFVLAARQARTRGTTAAQ